MSSLWNKILHRRGGRQYGHFCNICHRAGTCFGYLAREKGKSGGEETLSEGSQPLDVYEQCVLCNSSMCNERCLTGRDGIAKCLDCQR